ncbi:MAG: SPOR domain-containing protein [Treponema sp.]|nr:SPOR domain-containing protein [Treponema sp.]
MEQKKTLWIVAAAGVFLLVVVGAALILYSPSVQQSQGFQAGFDPSTGWISSTKNSVTPVPNNGLAFNTETPSASTENNVSSLTPSPFMKQETSEISKTAQNQDASSPIHADKITVISDNTTLYSSGTTTIDLNSLKASSSESNVVARNEMTENQIRENSRVEKPASQPVKTESYYTPAPKTTTSVASSKPASSSKTAAPAKSQAKKTTSSVAKSAPQTKAQTQAKVAKAAKKAPDSFWVQAAAYTSKRNADEARTTLESNKIPSEVFTFTDASGKTFYRVRVGPYVTKSEAEYWQTRIGMIDKFASAKSVIVNTAVN